jgi:hypothetical protein
MSSNDVFQKLNDLVHWCKAHPVKSIPVMVVLVPVASVVWVWRTFVTRTLPL